MIIKFIPVRNFTIIPNKVARDNTISFDTKGLLVSLISEPASWSITKASLLREYHNQTGRHKLDRMFDELIAHHYMYQTNKTKDPKRRFLGGHYIVFSQPVSEAHAHHLINNHIKNVQLTNKHDIFTQAAECAWSLYKQDPNSRQLRDFEGLISTLKTKPSLFSEFSEKLCKKCPKETRAKSLLHQRLSSQSPARQQVSPCRLQTLSKERYTKRSGRVQRHEAQISDKPTQITKSDADRSHQNQIGSRASTAPIHSNKTTNHSQALDPFAANHPTLDNQQMSSPLANHNEPQMDVQQQSPDSIVWQRITTELLGSDNMNPAKAQRYIDDISNWLKHYPLKEILSAINDLAKRVAETRDSANPLRVYSPYIIQRFIVGAHKHQAIQDKYKAKQEAAEANESYVPRDSTMSWQEQARIRNRKQMDSVHRSKNWIRFCLDGDKKAGKDFRKDRDIPLDIRKQLAAKTSEKK